MHHYFQKKMVVITGGSSGIGKALAFRLIDLGASVCLIGRRQELLESVGMALRNRCKESTQKVVTIALDVSDREAVAKESLQLLQNHQVDILINNAGIAYADYFEKTSEDWFEKMMQINYFGTVWMTRALLPHFKEKNAGHIVNVSSLAGILGSFGYSAYAPSKFAVIGFSEVLRNELSMYDIPISILLPPDTDTPQFEFENKNKPVETKALSKNAGVLTAEVVAEKCLEGIMKKTFKIIPNSSSKWIDRLIRCCPSLVYSQMDQIVKKAHLKEL